MGIYDDRYILLGGGGFALELMDWMQIDGHRIIGYIDDVEQAACYGYIPYLGSERTAELTREASYIIAVGGIATRKKMIQWIDDNDLPVGSFVSSMALVSYHAHLGRGAVVCPYVSISPSAEIGDFVMLNGASGVGHHAKLGSNVVVGPGARINGRCTVGSNVTFGANSALIPGTTIGDDAEIGIMTYPKKRVEDGQFYLAMPGRQLS